MTTITSVSTFSMIYSSAFLLFSSLLKRMLRSVDEVFPNALLGRLETPSADLLLSSVISTAFASLTMISGRTVFIWLCWSSNFSSNLRFFHATCLKTLFFSFSCSSSLWLGLVRGPESRICFAWLVALLMPRGTWLADVFLAESRWTLAKATSNKRNLHSFVTVIFDSLQVLRRWNMLFPCQVWDCSMVLYRLRTSQFIICTSRYLIEQISVVLNSLLSAFTLCIDWDMIKGVLYVDVERWRVQHFVRTVQSINS